MPDSIEPKSGIFTDHIGRFGHFLRRVFKKRDNLQKSKLHESLEDLRNPPSPKKANSDHISRKRSDSDETGKTEPQSTSVGNVIERQPPPSSNQTPSTSSGFRNELAAKLNAGGGFPFGPGGIRRPPAGAAAAAPPSSNNPTRGGGGLSSAAAGDTTPGCPNSPSAALRTSTASGEPTEAGQDSYLQGALLRINLNRRRQHRPLNAAATTRPPRLPADPAESTGVDTVEIPVEHHDYASPVHSSQQSPFRADYKSQFCPDELLVGEKEDQTSEVAKPRVLVDSTNLRDGKDGDDSDVSGGEGSDLKSTSHPIKYSSSGSKGAASLMSDQIPLRHQQQKHDRVFFSSVGSETSAEANQVLRRLRPVSTSTYFPSKMASSPPASSYTSSGSTQSRFTPYEIKFTPTTPPPTSRKPTQKPPRATTAAALVASPSPPAIAEPLPLSSVRLRSAVVEQPSLTDTRGGRFTAKPVTKESTNNRNSRVCDLVKAFEGGELSP